MRLANHANEARELRWTDRRGSRYRDSWLLLIDSEGTIHRFGGGSIPGVVSVVGSDYEKRGKWSGSYYRLTLAPGVRAVAGRDGWETGRFIEGLGDAVRAARPVDRWIDVANALGVTLGEAQRFLREWRPGAAEALDEVEKTLETVAGPTGDFEMTAVSFGGPTNREISEGFWDWPVLVTGEDGGVVGSVSPDPEEGWAVPVVAGPVRVVAHERSRGYHGGYVSMRLAVPAGTMAQHQLPAARTPGVRGPGGVEDDVI